MKNEITIKKRVTILASWDKIRIFLNKEHKNFKFGLS